MVKEQHREILGAFALVPFRRDDKTAKTIKKVEKLFSAFGSLHEERNQYPEDSAIRSTPAIMMAAPRRRSRMCVS